MKTLVALAVWAGISLVIGAIYAFVMARYNSRPMRTADQKQIERETAEIQRNAWETYKKTGRYETSLNDPHYPIDMEPDLADELIGWMQRWAKWVGLACATIGVAIYLAGKA